MISAGEVGAVFKIVDEASPVLKALMDQMNALQGVIDRTKIALKEITFPPGLNRSITNMDRALHGVADQAESTAKVTQASFDAIDKSVGHTAALVGDLKKEMRGLGPAGGTAGARNSIRRPHEGSTGLSAEAPTLPIPYGPNIRPTESSGGFWEMIGGAVALDAVKHFLAAGGELETQKKLLRDILGKRGNEGDIIDAVGYATRYATDPKSGVMGESVSEVLKGIRELVPVTPSLKDAEELYPSFMRSAKLLEELSGKPADESMQTLAKALENLGFGTDPKTGKLDPERMQNAALEAAKAIVAGGGFIDANAIFGFAKQSGGMGRIGTDAGKLFDEILTSMIDMGGQRSGTALAALGRQFLGDKMTVQTATALQDLGILTPGSWHKGGGTEIVMSPGKDINGVDIIKDPEKGIGTWLQEVWGPALKKKFGDGINTADIMQEAYKDFGTSTGQRLGLLFFMNEAQIERDKQIKNNVDPNAAYQGILDHDLAKNVDDLSKAYKSFEEVAGGPSNDAAVSGLHTLTAALHELTKVASISPEADSGFLKFFGSLGIGGLAGGISKFFGGPGFKEVAGWLAKYGAGPGSLPAFIDAATDDNRTPEAKARDASILAAIQGSSSDGKWSPAWFAIGDRAASDLSLIKNGYTPQAYRAEWDRERHRGQVMSSPQFAQATALPPAPIVNSETKVDVKVLLDGRAIAAAVEKYITTNNTFVNSASGHDGRLGFASPGMRN